MLYLEFRRRELRWSQSQLGKLVGIRQNLISQIESSQLLPTSAQQESLAAALGIPFELLLKAVIPQEATTERAR